MFVHVILREQALNSFHDKGHGVWETVATGAGEEIPSDTSRPADARLSSATSSQSPDYVATNNRHILPNDFRSYFNSLNCDYKGKDDSSDWLQKAFCAGFRQALCRFM
jgi:hypothetical protein